MLLLHYGFKCYLYIFSHWYQLSRVSCPLCYVLEQQTSLQKSSTTCQYPHCFRFRWTSGSTLISVNIKFVSFIIYNYFLLFNHWTFYNCRGSHCRDAQSLVRAAERQVFSQNLHCCRYWQYESPKSSIVWKFPCWWGRYCSGFSF